MRELLLRLLSRPIQTSFINTEHKGMPFNMVSLFLCMIRVYKLKGVEERSALTLGVK